MSQTAELTRYEPPADEIRLGIVHGMSHEDYLRARGQSNSRLNAMRKSPAHCWALYLDPDRPPSKPPTPQMLAGTLAHCAILEPAALTDRYAVKPDDFDGRTKEGKAWIAFHSATHEVITAAEYETASAQRKAVLAVPDLAQLLSRGWPEVSAFWTDDHTGQQCKARIDWLHPLPDGRVIALDLKTCSDASPAEFSRSVWNWGYMRQQAHYTNGLTACGLNVAAFIFAAVTNAYPYIAVAYMLDDESARKGADEIRELLDLYAECKRDNKWPAFGDGVQMLSLPAWAMR